MVLTRKARKGSYKNAKGKGNRSLRLYIGRCVSSSKLQFPDEDTAKKQAKQTRKNIGPKMTAYQCVYCLFWHIGHSRPLAMRIKRREEGKSKPTLFKKLAKREDLEKA